MLEYEYIYHLNGRKVLLETPSGFAMFIVKEFAFQEEKNIWVHFSDPEYAIQLDKSFISKFGFLRYIELNLETFPKELSRSFDEYVGIGETVKDGLNYAKVLASVLVPELVKKYGFSETFSPELASKLQQAKRLQAECGDDLTMADIEKIMGILNYLLNAPKTRDKILMDVKLMERKLFRSHFLERINEARSERGLDAVQRAEEPVDFANMKYRRALLQTPSGFAIFNVREDVLCYPENTWIYFSDIIDARNIVFALGFVRVDEHSVVRDSVIGPGDKLEQLILRFSKANEKLIVQDTELKAVIESKLDVKCWTGDEVVEELIWGLKHVLSDFIPEEKAKLTHEYFLPLSKQLLRGLETYKINVSASKMNWDFIYEFGHVNALDTICKTTSKALREKCDQYGSSIGGMEKDDLMYAWGIAKVVIPGLETETELAKIAGGLGSKQIDVPKDAGEAIADHDKPDILECLERLLLTYKQKSYVQQRLDELRLDMMTVKDQIGVRGKDETPAVGR